MTVKFSGFAAGSAIAGTDIPVGLQSSNNVQWTWNQIATFMWNNPVFTGTITIPGTLTLGTGPALLSSPAAAALQLGAADAGAPVAQTLQVQSVVGGTSNTAGQALTIAGSRGTGSGAGGNIVFQVASTGSSGSSQNPLVTALTLSWTSGATFTNSIFSQVSNGSGSFFVGNGAPAALTQTGLFTTRSNSAVIGWTASNASLLTIDAGFSCPAAATIQLGNADAAAPVAQTLSVQSVVAGTSNTAGVNWTLKASAGTGTGAGGNFVFQTAAAGASGSSQNTFGTAFTIDNSLGGGHAVTLLSTVGQTQFNTIDNLLSFGASNGINVNNTTGGYAINLDTFLTRAGAATWRLGQADAAAPIAQTLAAQSVVAGTTNTAGVNWTFIGSRSTGSGTSGDIIFQTGGTGAGATVQNTATTALTIKGATQQVNAAGTLSTGSNILCSGNLYFGGGSISYVSSAVDGTIIFSNAGATHQDFLTIPVSATWQLGQGDAASPVAQTVGVQSVVAGTSNTAGADWTFNASRSTGNAAGGRFVWQGAPAGGSGTSQNALVSLMVLDTTGSLTISPQASPFAFVKVDATRQMFTSGGGVINFGNSTTHGVALGCNDGNFTLDGQLQFQSAYSSTQNANVDTILRRAAAATIQFGAADSGSPVAQITQVQNVSTGTTNGNAVNWTLNGSTSTGSGTAGDIIFQTGGTGAGATAQNAQVTALTLKGATQQALFSNLVRIYNTTAIPAGGTTGTGYLLSSTANFGTFFGSGAPTLSAAEGSLYLRSDGTPQINTSGSTTWFDLASQASYAAKLAAVNFNSANTDTSFNVTLPPGFTRYRLAIVVLSHASASISTATFGLFSAAAGGGTAIVTGQAITVTANTENTNQNMQLVVPANAGTQSFNFSQLFFRVQTAQGSAATADVHIVINPIL